MINENSKKIYWLGLFVLGVFSLISTAVVLIPDLRHQARKLYFSETRKILAKSQAYLKINARDSFLTVLKIQKDQEIWVEVYMGAVGDPSPAFMTRLPIEENKDGYYVFQGRSANLILADIDHDGFVEILVPAFNEQQIPRLHVFHYNQETKTFERQLGGFVPESL